MQKWRRYWSDLGDEGALDGWNDNAPRDVIRRARESANVSRLTDVKTLYHKHRDRIIPSTLVTDEWRQMYLEALNSVCNEAAKHHQGDDENIPIPVCEELGHFIKYANGVQDPDFRRSGICP